MTIFRDGWNVFVKIAHTHTSPYFCPAVRPVKGRNRRPQRFPLPFLWSISWVLMISHCLFQYPNICLPSGLGWITQCLYQLLCPSATLFWFNHPISWSWRNTLWQVAPVCSAFHPRDAGLWHVGLSPGKGGREGGNSEVLGMIALLGDDTFFAWYWSSPIIPCLSSKFVWIKAVCISGENVQNVERARAV